MRDLAQFGTGRCEEVKRKYGRSAREEVLVGIVGLECFVPILKLPPAPVGVSARSGRAFRRFPGLSASIIVLRYEKRRLMVIEHCFPFPPLSRSPRAALHRLPLPAARPGLACAAAMILGTLPRLYGPVTRQEARHLHFSPIAFYDLFRAPGLVWYNLTRIGDRRRRDAPI